MLPGFGQLEDVDSQALKLTKMHECLLLTLLKCRPGPTSLTITLRVSHCNIHFTNEKKNEAQRS